MARNGTVCQVGNSRIAARLSPTKPTQAMSTQDRWGHCRNRRDARAALPGRAPPGEAPLDPGSADPGSASVWPATGSPLAGPVPGEPAPAGPASGERAMAERAKDAARHLGGTRLIRRCVDTISPHLIRRRGHATLAALPPAPASLGRPPRAPRKPLAPADAKSTPQQVPGQGNLAGQ